MSKVGLKVFLYVVLSVFAVIFVLPLFYSLLTSFKEMKFAESLFAGLNSLNIDSYARIIDQYKVYGGGVPKWYLNTIVMTLVIVVGCCLTATMTGYALSKLKFRGKNLIFLILVGTMAIPYHMILIPVYIMMAKVGWLNTMLALTVPYLYQCSYIFLLRQYYTTIPNDLLEAARIDGLSKIGAFFKIMLPLSKQALATVIIISFTGTWNSYLIPLTFTNRPEMYTLVQGLNAAKDQFFDRPNVTMAGVVLTTIPVILVFLKFQKYYIQGIASTGIKG